MKFIIKPSYSFDLLNLLNVLTGDEFYTSRHTDDFSRFGEMLSATSKDRIERAVALNESAMLGPSLCLYVSAVPDFESARVIDLLSDAERIRGCYSGYSYYQEGDWPTAREIISLCWPVIEEVEASGFGDYWQQHHLPHILQCREGLQPFVDRFHLDGEIDAMLGSGQAPDEITLYLGGLASPHGMKLCGPRFVSDASYPNEITVNTAIHEMFHPPYNPERLRGELEALALDPLLQQSFAGQNPKMRYGTIEGFIEENVVDAMMASISHKLGLMDDAPRFFDQHDEGSHKFSVILLDAFQRYPKDPTQRFEDYFRGLVQKLPVGSLDGEYQALHACGARTD